MPELNELSRRDKLGLKGRSKMIWAACFDCKEERWFMFSLFRKRDGKPICVRCHGYRLQPIGRVAKKPNLASRQTGAGNHQWKGGRSMHKSGYVLLTVDRSDPLSIMGGRQIFEHRIVMARSLGRPSSPLNTFTTKTESETTIGSKILNFGLFLSRKGKGRTSIIVADADASKNKKRRE